MNNRAPISASQFDSARYNSLDIRVSKSLQLTERRKVDFIAQVFNAFGTTLKQAGPRFEECLTAVKRLWTEPTVTMQGSYFKLDNANCSVPIIQKPTPPVWIGANIGVGIRRARAAGMGLRVMQYRANAVRGTLAVESAPDKGTKIICSLRRGLADADPGRAQNDSSSRDSQTK